MCRRRGLGQPCMASAGRDASVTRCGRHSGAVGCNWAGCGLECAITERLTSPHEAAVRTSALASTAAKLGRRGQQSDFGAQTYDCDDHICKQQRWRKKASVRSPMSLPGCGKRQESWLVRPGLDDWAGGCSAVTGCAYLLIAISAQPFPIIQHSSNGLHDTLQRALGPDLGRNAHIRLFSLSQTPLSPTAPVPHLPVRSLSR